MLLVVLLRFSIRFRDWLSPYFINTGHGLFDNSLFGLNILLKFSVRVVTGKRNVIEWITCGFPVESSVLSIRKPMVFDSVTKSW